MSTMTSDSISSDFPAPLTSSDDLVYQSVSRSAVASIVLALFGLLSLVFAVLLIFPLLAIVLGITSLLAIRRYPNELLGKQLANAGIALGGLMMVVAPAYHAYVYATEVPPGYTRIAFASLISPKGAADVPPDQALDLDGQQVFVKGYMHPSSLEAQGKKFVLVPDLGTCCFGGQPPLTHMIEVTLTGDNVARKDMSKKKLAGTLRVNRSLKPIDGLQGVYYTLKADYIH